MRIQILSVVAGLAALTGMADKKDASANSIGMKMIRVPAGVFKMGNELPTDPAALKQFPLLTDGDYDEKPAHEVRISHDFLISETEVTSAQFATFRADFQDMGPSSK